MSGERENALGWGGSLRCVDDDSVIGWHGDLSRADLVLLSNETWRVKSPVPWESSKGEFGCLEYDLQPGERSCLKLPRLSS